MKTTVVLSAYNGEKYILEQLISIKEQTVPVDEVLVFDDCSTDNTASVCKSFIDKNNLDWHIETNSTNKGFVENFFQGFQKATGDIIFICDQDDIWCSNKVERTKYYFEKYPDALSICSGFSRFCDDKVFELHVNIPNRKKNGGKKISFDEFCRFHWYLGMTTAFKKEILNKKLEECIKSIPYDISVNLIAILNNGLYYVDEVLVHRRSYSESTSNRIAGEWAKKEFNGNIKLYRIYRHTRNLKLFETFISEFYPDYIYVNVLEAYINTNNIRFDYIEKQSVIKWLCNSIKVVRCFSVKKHMKDLLSILK